MNQPKGVTVKAATVVVDTEAAQLEREERANRVRGHLAAVDREQARFPTVLAMLSWYFVMHEHMTGAPAIDPSQEVIQGGRGVDRDERIAWLGKIARAMTDLVIAQGHPWGLTQLWLVHRAPVPIGTEVRNGQRVTKWSEGPLPIRQLSTAENNRREGFSRRRCEALFWEAVEELESYCLNRNWVAGRVERRPRAQQVYRRTGKAVE